jgi:hypothetical protein
MACAATTTENSRDDGEPYTLAAALVGIVRQPGQRLVRRWNWKSAVMSSLARGLLFFAANLSAGPGAAMAAFSTELVFRMATSGFYGALTQSFRSVEPAWHGMAAAMVLLPLVAHTLELSVHWWRGTAELATSIAASVAFTILSTAFNVFAMRRGALIVGGGSESLGRDLQRIPRLIVEFVAVPYQRLRRLSASATPEATTTTTTARAAQNP